VTRGWAVALVVLVLLGVAVRARHGAAPPFDFHPTRQYYALLFAQDYRHTLCGDVRSLEARAARANRTSEALLEPPVVPALTALGWCALGRESFVWPRMLMAAVWCLGALWLGLIARALGGSPVASLFAAGWMLFHPYALAAGRSVQPDVPMVTLLLGLAWCVLRIRGTTHPRWGGVVATLGAAVFVKLVALFFVGPLLGLAWCRAGASRLRALWRWGAALVPAVLWYAHGWFFEGALRRQGSGRFKPALFATAHFWHELGLRIDAVTGLRVVYLALALCTLVLRGDARALCLAWLAGQVCLGVVFTQHIYTHDYYLLPLLPWVGLVLGLGVEALCSRLPRGFQAAQGIGAVVGVVLAVGGVRSAWRAADAAMHDAGDEVAQGLRVGEAVGHRSDVLLQARWYGLPLKFHGRFGAEYWPDHNDLADDPRPWSPQARMRLGYHGQRFAWFVLADPREIPLQPALLDLLSARCTQTLSNARVRVFACPTPLFESATPGASP